MDSEYQGVVHVMGPELGLTLPGNTIVCGDSHTATHGAFGALAFGIGTSEVEHVLATQCLPQKKSKTMNIKINGALGKGVTAKDIILGVISQYGTDFGTGHVMEFTGEAIRKLTMEERMTVCNMAIEAGARSGLIAPDQTTFDYLRGRLYAPQGEAYEAAVAEWKSSTPTLTLSSTKWSSSTLLPSRRRSPGALPPAWAPRSTTSSPIRKALLILTSRKPPSAPSTTWALSPELRCRTSRSTMPLSAPAPMAVLKTCAPPPRLPKAVKSALTSPHWSSRAQSKSKSKQKPKASTRSSSKLALNGASPAAACAWP